jgi:hypothetical protein
LTGKSDETGAEAGAGALSSFMPKTLRGERVMATAFPPFTAPRWEFSLLDSSMFCELKLKEEEEDGVEESRLIRKVKSKRKGGTVKIYLQKQRAEQSRERCRGKIILLVLQACLLILPERNIDQEK